MESVIISLKNLGLKLVVNANKIVRVAGKLQCEFAPKYFNVVRGNNVIGYIDGELTVDEIVDQKILRGYDSDLKGDRVIPVKNISHIELKNDIGTIILA